MSETDFPPVATEEFDHFRGNEARSANFGAARGVAESVRTTLGPTGLDKMLVSSHGAITVTNDGETVLKEMDVDHPAARTLVEVAKTQAEEVGDGTTTAVLIASELLCAAEDLFERGIHPTVIVDGYQRALSRAIDVVDGLAERIESDSEVLRHIVASSLTGKVVSVHAESLAPLVLNATRAVTVENVVDLEYLQTVPVTGASPSRSKLSQGAALDAAPCHEAMPTDLPDARVLLLQQDFVVNEPEIDFETRLDSAEHRERFVEREDQWIGGTLDHLENVGVTAVLCDGRVSETIERQLASRGILAIEHVDRTDVAFEFLMEVTGATPLTDPGEATPEQLGSAAITRDGLFYVENPETHGVTLIARGTTEPIAAEVERSVRDSINVVAQVVADGRALSGGGAPEIEIAARLRDHAASVDERMQLAIEAFADAAEVIPRTLAINAGLDPVDALVRLRNDHESGRTHAGVNAVTGEVDDMFDAEVIQPAYVTEQSMYNATKVAAILLKIDEIIVAPRSSYDDEEGE